MPRLQAEIKRIVQSLSERDREDFFRLKRFKQKGLRKKTEMAATRAPRTPRESKAL
jgi:vacuolar-type H+-ATPase subunit D/Vma8